MAPFPQGRLPFVVEIAPGAAPASDPSTWTWVDVTAFVRVRDRITITAGRGDWGARVDAGSCSLVFDNRSGDFAQHNPAGQWYGLLGRDTPLRVRLRRVEDTFGRTVSNGLGVADSGQVWSVATGPAADISAAAGAARHAHSTVNILRRTVLSNNLLDCEQLVDVSTSVLLTGAALVTGLVFRHTAGANYYWLRCEFNSGGTSVMLKISKSVAGTITDLAVLNPVPALAYAANTPLRVRASVGGDRLAIKVWAAAGVEPAGWQLTATDRALTGPGATGFQSWLVAGNTNALPVTASWDNYRVDVDLAGGLVPTWVPRMDITGKDRIVPVDARGALHRLQPASGKSPKRSPLRRTLSASASAYWPVEDGVDASVAASAIAGHPPLSMTGVVAYKSLEEWVTLGFPVRYGTAALADLSGGGQLWASVPAAVTAATATGWTVAVVADPVSTAGLSADLVLAEVATPGGTYVRWRLVATKTSRTQVIAYDSAGASTLVVDYSGIFVTLAPWDFAVWQSGGTINAGYGWRSVGGYRGSGSVAGTLAGVASVSVNATGVTNTAPMPVGHIAVWAGHDLPVVDYLDGGMVLALFAYAWSGFGTADNAATGEPATVRLARLAAEDGIAITMPAVDADAELLMAEQPIEAPLPLYQQCEDVDGGVLYERPFGLAYQPRSARYNQTPALILNATGGDLAAAPEPDMEGQGYRNRWTVERVNGSSVVAETDDVAAGLAVVYDDSATLNLVSDAPLPDAVGWRLHLSSGEGLRWPKLELDLAARPALIDAWLNCRVGSRIRANNPPADVAGQDIDVMLEGYTLTLGYKDFDVTANCSPAQPWDVAEADGIQRVGAEGSTLAVDLVEGGSSSVTDTFARSVAAGWGTADTGQVWATSGGSASDYSADGAAGLHSVGSVNVARRTVLAGSLADMEIVGSIVVPALAAGAPINVALMGRFADASNHYLGEIQLNTDQSVQVRLRKNVAATFTTLVTSAAVAGLTHTATRVFRLRFQVQGSTLRARVWDNALAEPTVWHAETTDTALTAAGQVGARSILGVGNTTALPVVISYDNLTAGGLLSLSSTAANGTWTTNPANFPLDVRVGGERVTLSAIAGTTSPQTATISARGVNGIQRAWPAGTEVNVWAPAIAPL